jgi:hypothetical protein
MKMLLKQLKLLAEGRMKDKSIDLLDAIKNEYECDDEMCQAIHDWLHDKDNQKAQDFLMDHYGYSSRGGDRDWSNALADRVSSVFKDYM